MARADGGPIAWSMVGSCFVAYGSCIGLQYTFGVLFDVLLGVALQLFVEEVRRLEGLSDQELEHISKEYQTVQAAFGDLLGAHGPTSGDIEELRGVQGGLHRTSRLR